MEILLQTNEVHLLHPPHSHPFHLRPSASPFHDTTAEANITFRHVDGRTGEKYLIETLGSGALFFDYDNDGNLELYVVNANTIPPSVENRNTLYRNNGDGTFTDVTDASGVGDIGYGVGCAAADIDNDGYVDIMSPTSVPTASIITTAMERLPTLRRRQALAMNGGERAAPSLTTI